MWAHGSQRGREHIALLRADIESLNRRWLTLIGWSGVGEGGQALVTRLGVGVTFQQQVKLALYQDASLERPTTLGVPIFKIDDPDSVANQLEALRAGDTIPRPSRPENDFECRLLGEYHAVAYAYLKLIRESLRHDPVLTCTVFGLDERMVRLTSCNLDQLEQLAHSGTFNLTIRHQVLTELVKFPAKANPPLADIARYAFLLAMNSNMPAPPANVAKTAPASDQYRMLGIVAGLVAHGVRINRIIELTKNRRSFVEGVVKHSGTILADPGGRRPSRLPQLIETAENHIKTSFFLSNYIRARTGYGDRRCDPGPEAFLAALTLSHSLGHTLAIDPDLAVFVATLYHQGQVKCARCHCCDSAYLTCAEPIPVARDVVTTGDCPICLESYRLKKGLPASAVYKLSGMRRVQLAELASELGSAAGGL